MPINRRNMLATTGASLAAALTTATTATAGAALPSPDASVIALAGQLDKARADLASARDAVEWIVDEYRHLWPLAPEILLGGANMHIHRLATGDTAEKDIASRPLIRETASLTKRFSRKQREANPKTCFAVYTAAATRERLDAWKAYQPVGKTPAKLARDVQRRDAMLKTYGERLEPAIAYEAETARLRSLSGIEAAADRVDACSKHVNALAEQIIRAPVTTLDGLMAKAGAATVLDLASEVKGLPIRMQIGAFLTADILAIEAGA